MNKKLTETDNQFEWVIFCIGGTAPTVTHDSEESATKEASRLLKIDPSKKFFVARIKATITSTFQTKVVKVYE